MTSAFNKRLSTVAWSGLVVLALALGFAVSQDDLRASPMAAAVALAAAIAGAAAVARAAHAVTPAMLLTGLMSLRALALFGHPTLSDDIHRYIHEGRAQRLGFAVPYTTPPRAVTPPPDDGTTARVNHPDVPAAYPPGAELVLWVSVLAGDAMGHPLLPLRLVLVAADLAVLTLLYRQRHRRPSAFAWYGSHPLPLLEVALGAHLDGLGMAGIIAAVLVRRPVLSGVWIGLSAHIKPMAALALVGMRRASLHLALAGFALAVALPALPYLNAGAPLHRGFVEYATRWRAAPFVYAACEAALEPMFARRTAEGRYAHLHVRSDGFLVEDAGRPILALGSGQRAQRPILMDARFCARVLVGVMLGVVVFLLARSRAAPETRIGLALAAFWLLAPTVHPWYLTWLVPFAALTSSRALWIFAAASPVLYQPVFEWMSDHTWNEELWPRMAVSAALIVGLVLDLCKRRAST